MTTDNSLGSRALLIHDTSDPANNPGGYYFVTETEWKKYAPVTEPAEKGVSAVLGELGTGPAQLLLDLDLMKGLEAPKPTPVQTKEDVQPNDKAIFIREGKKYFVAPKRIWQPLPDDLSQATAKALVTRGVVVAAIPPNTIPVGAYCVLINIAGLT